MALPLAGARAPSAVTRGLRLSERGLAQREPIGRTPGAKPRPPAVHGPAKPPVCTACARLVPRAWAGQEQLAQRRCALGRHAEAFVRPTLGIEAAAARLLISRRTGEAALSACDRLDGDLVAAAIGRKLEQRDDCEGGSSAIRTEEVGHNGARIHAFLPATRWAWPAWSRGSPGSRCSSRNSRLSGSMETNPSKKRSGPPLLSDSLTWYISPTSANISQAATRNSERVINLRLSKQ